MKISQALRLGDAPCLAAVGAGGKTSALFHLAGELPPPVIVTATTHLSVDQIRLADSHWILNSPEEVPEISLNYQGVMLITGPIEGDRTKGLDEATVRRLHALCKKLNIPLLIEADGSRQLPLKAPAEHEPAIPEFVEQVVAVAGMSGLEKPLSLEHVHRPEIFSRLSGLKMNEIITPEALAQVLTHPEGGLKGIPPKARRTVLLNQADTPGLRAKANLIAEKVFCSYHAVLTASLKPFSGGENQPCIHTIQEPVAGIILAAGEARRFGQIKQLLDWCGKPMIRHIAECAIAAGLSPVVVVSGAKSEQVSAAVRDLPVLVKHNPKWRGGISSSIRAGLNALPEKTGAAVFLLADQPTITPILLRALVEQHSLDLGPITAPQVKGQQSNPVLFDRTTFPDLMQLTGDVGGRVLFSKFPVTFIPWHDETLLMDIDTPDDYDRLRA